MEKHNYLLSAGLFVFSLVFLFVATSIDVSRATSSLSPAFWPKFLLISLIILSIALGIRTKYSKKEIIEEDDNDLMEEFLDDESIKSSLISRLGFSIIVILLGYIIIIPWVGFIFATFLFIIFIAIILGQKIWKSIVFSLISASLVGVIFVGLLNLSFPRGIGVFQTLSSIFT